MNDNDGDNKWFITTYINQCLQNLRISSLKMILRNNILLKNFSIQTKQDGQREIINLSTSDTLQKSCGVHLKKGFIIRSIREQNCIIQSFTFRFSKNVTQYIYIYLIYSHVHIRSSLTLNTYLQNLPPTNNRKLCQRKLY